MTHTLTDLTDRLGELLDDRPTAENALFEAMRDLSLAHADHLRAIGPVRVLAFDPCPRCSGRVIAGDTEAKCAAGCDWSYSQHGGRPCSTS